MFSHDPALLWATIVRIAAPPRFTDAFKFGAVRLTRKSGRPITQVPRELGTANHLLYRRRGEQRHIESQGQTRQSMRARQDELARLK